ncbi:MAG: hypothetical protein ACREP9_18285, partial [Candidatus Dormibacteraceae bacterium]
LLTEQHKILDDYQVILGIGIFALGSCFCLAQPQKNCPRFGYSNRQNTPFGISERPQVRVGLSGLA